VTEPIDNTPYTVLKYDQNQEIVKNDPVRTVAPFTHNGSINYSRGAKRPTFFDENGGPNEQRFGLNDDYDKSIYFSKVRRTKLNITFDSYTARYQDLIEKGGEIGIDNSSHTKKYYNSFK
jgi:hypothetical protein